MEKKRVDVKETRNLAKNKGREKKDGRKKRHPHRHLDDREGVGMTITGTEVSVQTAVGNIVNDVLHLLDYILIATSEYEAGEVKGVETEDDGSGGEGY